MKNIKDEIMNSQNHFLYCIPAGDQYNIILKDFGQIEITKSLSRIFSLEDLNREWYFNNYIRPFTESITVEFV